MGSFSGAVRWPTMKRQSMLCYMDHSVWAYDRICSVSLVKIQGFVFPRKFGLGFIS